MYVFVQYLVAFYSPSTSPLCQVSIVANPRAISTNLPPVHLEASGILSLSLSFCSCLCLILSFSLSVSLWLIQELSALPLSHPFWDFGCFFFVFVFYESAFVLFCLLSLSGSLWLIQDISALTPQPSIFGLQAICLCLLCFCLLCICLILSFSLWLIPGL